MNRFRYRLQRFMTGRYGLDELYYFLLILYTFFVVLNVFIRSAEIYIAAWVLLIYSLFRVLSRNISARQKENAKFLVLKSKSAKFFRSLQGRIKDKEHVYKKCPHCKATLRFPRKKGKHDAVCPRCKGKMKVNVRF